MPNRNGVPFDLKRAEVRTRKTDYYDLILRRIPLRQGTNGSIRHHFCLLKARGVRSNDVKGKGVSVCKRLGIRGFAIIVVHKPEVKSCEFIG